ncbi:hypothetical protein ACH5RR_036145 [Cinchona calisaya]|uniref:Regulator of Vps4 activity in the MVB pathway protein n=1 Tax=Cinchona calisaya TaxID=153742 RepID=A0ABD2Y2C7_9GENT
MGRKLDALFRRKFKTDKFNATMKLGISRLSVLKNQRQARCSVARSDVLQLLNLGQHDRALLRVEQVIREQNMLDVYVMIEGYCHQLIERIDLIEHEKTCPEELMETVSSLIYAATRCGEFPELQEIRAIFTSRFGKEFAARAVELRNNCGVNPKMIQKLSTRMPSLDNRMKVLKEIASENNIVLQIEEVELEKAEEQKGNEERHDQPKPKTPTHSGDSKLGRNMPVLADLDKAEGCLDSMETRNKYKDVAAAAQAAFESAAYAAAAARAAVELSRSDSHDPDDPRSPKMQPRVMSSTHQSFKSSLQTGEKKDSRGVEKEKVRMVPVQNYSSESEEEGMDKAKKFNQAKIQRDFERSLSTSSSESFDNTLSGTRTFSNDELLMKLQEKELVFDESDDESHDKSREILSRNHDLGLETKRTSHGKKVLGSEQAYSIKGDVAEESYRTPYSPAHKHFPLRSQAGFKMEKAPAKFMTPGAEDFNMEKSPVSARTKRTYGR